MRRILIPVISLLALPLAIAQDVPPAEDLVVEQTRHYKVEIIVFSYEENVSIGSEVFLADEPPPIEEPLLDEDGYPLDTALPPVYDDDTVAETADEELEAPPVWVVDTGEGGEGLAADADSRDLRFVLLGEDQLELSAELRKFELLDAYKTIMHIGWIQPTYPEEETPAIEIRLLGEPPQGLDGSFTLYLSRYLHLVVDLALDAPGLFEEEVMVDETPAFSFGDSRTQYADDFNVQRLPVRYRIQENRIVKNGELRYFDHPKFGVLAKIVRVEEEEEEVLIPLVGAGSQ